MIVTADGCTRFEDLAEIVAWHELHPGVEVDRHAGRVEHATRSSNAVHVLDQRLPVGFVERRELACYPHFAVWANDSTLELVVKDGHGLLLERCDDEPGFHDRLDELAGLEVAA